MRFGMGPDNGRVNRVSKLVVNPWTGPIECCWDDCWNKARDSYIMRFHEHTPAVPCSWVEQAGGQLGRHTFYTFCCREHADFWAACSGSNAHETAARNRGQIYGQASTGNKIGRFR